MNGQPIPGFYWDPEKKKYFKIQSARAARDLNLKYSAANIRKTDLEERVQKKIAAQTNKVKQQRVVRRHASNLSQTCAERELGFRTRAHYMHDLWPHACAAGMRTDCQVVMPRPSSSSYIRLFDRDPVSQTVYALHGDNILKRRRIYASSHGPPLPDAYLDDENYFESLSLNSYFFEPWDELGRTTSTVSSLCYLPASGAVAITTVGSDRPPVVQLSDPERDGPYVSQQFTPKNCTAIWGAAARPVSFSPSPGIVNTVAASHIEHLAVAASKSMLLFTRSQTGIWDSAIAVNHLDSDIFAVEWISYTTVAMGCRNGQIHLYDTRSGGSSHILTHANSVSKLKQADDSTRIVCSGLEDTLFLYDVRAARPVRDRQDPRRKSFHHDGGHYNTQYFDNIYPNASRQRKRQRMNRVASRKWSQPVLSIPHANVDDIGLDIDVHPSLGLVAAAEDEETGVSIRVSNLWTGKIVREIKTGRFGDRTRNKSTGIRTLKFMDSDEGVDLWATWKGGIARFGW